jgi:hypothetical protein
MRVILREAEEASVSWKKAAFDEATLKEAASSDAAS